MTALGDGWINRLGTGPALAGKPAPGWSSEVAPVAGFVKPRLICKYGNPDTAQIIIIAAPGAVGKSSYAKELCRDGGKIFVDLAQTEPLGGHFFVGGLHNAYGPEVITALQSGIYSLVVDSLDEAQLRATSDTFVAGMKDLAGLVSSSGAAPAVVFGRTIAAEEAYLQLEVAGHEVALLEITFFEDDQAEAYLKAKLPVIAGGDEKVMHAFAAHGAAFFELARKVRTSLASASGEHGAHFSGYAPVLDAICAFVLDEDALNPVSRDRELSAASNISLLQFICTTILEREQLKLREQLRRKDGLDTPEDVLQQLYTPAEQMALLSGRLLGTPKPSQSPMSPEVEEAYRQMVEAFLPQHPFITDSGHPANVVFSAYITSWAIQRPGFEGVVRSKLAQRGPLMNGLFFEMYLERDPETRVVLPLDDVGVLYSSLGVRLLAGQRAYLEINQPDEDDVVLVTFGIVDNLGQGVFWGAYEAETGGTVELRSTVHMLNINAPIDMSIGDGALAYITDSSEILVRNLEINAEKLRIGQAFEGHAGEVVLAADEAAVDTVSVVDIGKSHSLAVSWPDADKHPWGRYQFEPDNSDDDTLAFMRRRLRKILTAFRSHSKGSMRRFAGKMEHTRMVKDERGRALLEALLADKVLSLVEEQKFYELNPTRLSEILGLDYVALQKQKYTAKSDAYVMTVAG